MAVSPDPLRVVVGVDASDAARRALTWAARYAQLVGASLEVVHCWHLADEYAWIQPLPPPAGSTDIAREALEQMVHDVVGEEPLSIKTLVVEGGAAKALVGMVDSNTLLVVGSCGNRGIDGLLIGSVSRQCTAHAPCTVVVVR